MKPRDGSTVIESNAEGVPDLLADEQRVAQDRAYEATSAGLNNDAYDAAVASAFKTKEGERASGSALANTGTNLAGIEQTAWTGAGALADTNRKQLTASGTALTDDMVKTTEALTTTGNLEQSPAVTAFNQKKDAATLYGNVASNAVRGGAALAPTDRLTKLAGSLGALGSARKLGLM